MGRLEALQRRVKNCCGINNLQITLSHRGFLSLVLAFYCNLMYNKGMKSLKVIEFLGVLTGISGSFLVARGVLAIGFCLFLVSSICLLTSAVKQKNWNLTTLQGTFLVSNVLGVSNYVFGI